MLQFSLVLLINIKIQHKKPVYISSLILGFKKYIMSVFISYEWTSKNIVHKIVQDLETKYNQKTWIDLTQIRHGINLHEEIQTGINKSEIIVAFVTLAYCKVVCVEVESLISIY